MMVVMLPSGKQPHNYGKSPFHSWVNPLFLWQLSIVFLMFFVCLPEGKCYMIITPIGSFCPTVPKGLPSGSQPWRWKITTKHLQKDEMAMDVHSRENHRTKWSAWWFQTWILFSISCHPAHWLSYFSRWLLHHQPVIIRWVNFQEATFDDTRGYSHENIPQQALLQPLLIDIKSHSFPWTKSRGILVGYAITTSLRPRMMVRKGKSPLK